VPRERRSPTVDDLVDSLRRHFRHESFRQGQERLVRAVLEGHDVLAVMPTGIDHSTNEDRRRLMTLANHRTEVITVDGQDRRRFLATVSTDIGPVEAPPVG
jgi:hypothetical protein